ncbi:hypothetical protein PSACC_00636 [Paramicrosporidium saccamoebae]|uniref:Uncharacterized protein n=1 Tax=Paramicrosporidium saccamoebae TaxID=1246581 RepID=A0A2H9TP68_9FUNG|nr:hypothetical protein PSACC_00636 [Paramicrosporidium saccamoebae]
MNAASGDWSPYDVKASWVAVFVMFIFWWLSYLPLLFTSNDRKPEDGVIMTPIEDGREGRFRRISKHFRDGTLILVAATSISAIAAGPYGATNALTWIFLAFWIILAVLMMFFKWRRLFNLLIFLDLILPVALISNAFAHGLARSSLLS